MARPGPETLLTKELFRKIKECVFKRMTLRDIAKTCEISEATFYTWHSDNYLRLADKIDKWKTERRLVIAEGNLDDVLEMECISKVLNKEREEVVIEDTQKLKIKTDTSKFVAETIGKSRYSKKQEIEASGDLNINIISYKDGSNNTV